MDISVIDRSAVLGDTWLHRAGPPAKLASLALLLAAVVVTWNAFVALALALGLAALVLASGLPSRPVFGLAAYPVVFAALFAFASAPDPLTATVIVLKAFAAALGAVIVIFSTPYPQVFAPIQRVAPSLVGDALLMTYRSLFILLGKMADLLRAVRLRSATARRWSVASARATVRSLGGLVLYALDLSQRDYDIMRVRGYEGRLRVAPLGRKAPALDAAVVAGAVCALAVSAAWRLGAGQLNAYAWLLPAAAMVPLAAAAVFGKRG